MNDQKDYNLHQINNISHVTGESVYINDMLAENRLLHGHVVYSRYAHAKILKLDVEEARRLPGVFAVITAAEIPGENQMGPVIHDEPCLAAGEVLCFGQAVALIATVDAETALRAEKLINIEYQPLETILTIEEAIKNGTRLATVRNIETGNPEQVFAHSKNIFEGKLFTGAQEHWYLETQSCLCIPGESGQMMVYSSTQHPSETQAIVAEVLGLPFHSVTVEVKRMGGAFGGKETQANHTAAWTALLANASKRPVKIHLFRDDDQIITGKRHRFLSTYKVAYDDTGKITALDAVLNADGGIAADLSLAILERALFHIDNAYFIPNLRVKGIVWKTNLPSNTAFRGFGGPQGMAVIETIIDKIARKLKKDPAEIRRLNFYGIGHNNLTHYDQIIENNSLHLLYEKILQKSDYQLLRKEAEIFNSQNEFYKKGVALTPVKFGISFTTSFLNQAGAFVNIYKDGTMLVNHGGTEMGQGLNSKIHQIAAKELGVSAGKIIVSATNTSKVPNTSATAASSGSDLNGMAVKAAIEKLKNRLAKVAVEILSEDHQVATMEKDLLFENDNVADMKNPTRSIGFKDLIRAAYLQQVSLSATGFYKTPGIFFDREKGKGKPFHYYTFGMSVSEILLDTLTGYHKILKTFIVQDVGNSIYPEIDRGQVEGGFIQGVGWCTTEEIKWDKNGFLLTHSPDTYKIPGVRDIPQIFEVELPENLSHHGTIHNSKAVGEPPFMLAFSVWLAIKDAISAVGNHQYEPDFQIPATNEVILQSIEKIKNQLPA